MQYSRLAVVLSSLLASLGDVPPWESVSFHEDFAGDGGLTTGVRLQGLRASRLDASKLHW